MDHEELLSQLMETFTAELDEHVETLSRGLMTLERAEEDGERKRLLEKMFRAAHGIKGSAGTMELHDIERIAHRVEDIFSALKEGRLAPSPELIDRILAAVDVFNPAMEAHRAGEPLSAARIDEVLSALPEETATDGDRKGDDRSADCGAEQIRTAESDASVQTVSTVEESRVAQGPTEDEPEKDTGTYDPCALPGPGAARPSSCSETIRVTTEKIDLLMDAAGELLVEEMRSKQRLEEIAGLRSIAERWQKQWRKVKAEVAAGANDGTPAPVSPPLREYLLRSESYLTQFASTVEALEKRHRTGHRRFSALTGEMRRGIRRLRMVSVGPLFESFHRTVRSLSRTAGKQVALVLDGKETELDRYVLEAVKDPLNHLVRNALDHGIEAPQVRKSSGKPEGGTIRLSARPKGAGIVLTVADDGAGIDLEALASAAVEREMVSAADAEALDDGQRTDLIFASGLSTKKKVSTVSGRGVGLDAVRDNLGRIHGRIEVKTAPGKGTKVSLIVPLTVATSHVLMMEVAGQAVGIPTTAVERTVQIEPADMGTAEGKPALRFEGRPLPVYPLQQLLELPVQGRPEEASEKIYIVVVGAVEKRLALRVDRLLDTRQVLVKSLGSQIRKPRHISGATIQADGRPAMILNAGELIRSARSFSVSTAGPVAARPAAAQRQILVVDDSITTRTLEKNILETAGYRVLVAADGQQGWELVQSEPVDAMILDVEMPRMDGIELARKVRSNQRFDNTPVVLVTSRGSSEDKIRGMEAGADAYIVKGAFDQERLLETVERLIG